MNKKEYRKAKIFLLRQDTLQLPDDAEAASTDDQSQTLTTQLQTVTQQTQKKRSGKNVCVGQFLNNVKFGFCVCMRWRFIIKITYAPVYRLY